MRPLPRPRLIDPSGREPGLAVDLRDERRALLFDLGETAQLSPRVRTGTRAAWGSPPGGAGADEPASPAPG